MRERQAQAIEADPSMPVRDVDELLSPAVQETLTALNLKPEDTAAARLAERYAAVIDSARDPSWAMRWIGPELLRVLAELGATPMSRPKQQPTPAGPSRLDQLRSVRRQYMGDGA